MKTLNRILTTALAGAGLLGTALPAHAKLTADEAARLGADLTPMGAEKAGNKDGTIPAWTGGLCAPPAGWMGGGPQVYGVAQWRRGDFHAGARSERGRQRHARPRPP